MGLFDFAKKGKYFKIAEQAFAAEDYETSAENYRLAMECGHTEAQRYLAYQYRFGFGVEEDAATAYKLYVGLFDKTGDESLLSLILDMYACGELEGIRELSDEECFDYAYRGAHAEGRRAYYLLGYYYCNGIGCEKNGYLGARWLYTAYLDGDTSAVYEIGKMFDTGDGYFPAVPAYAKHFLLRAKAIADGKGDECPEGLLECLAQEKYVNVSAIEPDEEYFNRCYRFNLPIVNSETRPSPDGSLAIAKAHSLGVDDDGNAVEVDPETARLNYTRAADQFYYVAEYAYANYCYPVGNGNAVVGVEGELEHLGDSPNLYINYMESAAAKGDLDAMMDLVTESLREDGPFSGKGWDKKYIPLISSLHGLDYHTVYAKEKAENATEDTLESVAKKLLPEREVHERTATYEFKGIMRGDSRVSGVLTDFVDGWTYEGEFRDGIMSGKAKLTYKDGDIDEGYFSEGRLHGVGIRRTKNHTTWGDFREGKRSGFCIVKQLDGQTVAGIYKDGYPDGLMFYRHKDGEEEVGIFNSDWENTTLENVKRRIGGDIPSNEFESGAVFYGQTDEESCTIHGWGWCFDKRGSAYVLGKFKYGSMTEGVKSNLLPNGKGGYDRLIISAEKWDDGCPSGRCTVIYFSESDKTAFVYDGEMADGRYHGEGTYRSTVGNTVSGVFKNNTLVNPLCGTNFDGTPMSNSELALASISEFKVLDMK